MRRGQVAVVHLRKPEVCKFDYHVRAVVFEEQVFGLDISVCNVMIVATLQRLCDLKHGQWGEVMLHYT